jgi:ubiquinone biosynthesis protein
MGIAMIIAALIVGSSILILADRVSREHGFIGTLGLIGLVLAGINTAGFVISYLLPRKQKE